MIVIELENKRIVKDLKKKDLESINNWILSKRDKLYKIAWSYLYNHADIEDVLQNTMIKAYENIRSLKKIDKFETWFISILINECRQHLRDGNKVLLQEDVEVYGSHVDQYNFFQEINQIDEIFKEVIILKYVSGYSQEEIGVILNIPIGTVKSRIYRRLRDLKILLKEVE